MSSEPWPSAFRYVCKSCSSQVLKIGKSMFKCTNEACEHGENYESNLVGYPDFVHEEPVK